MKQLLFVTKITQSNYHAEEKRNDTIHVLSIHFTNDHIFFNINHYQNLSGNTEKISQDNVGSAPPFYFGTGHVTVLSAPPWKMEYSGLR